MSLCAVDSLYLVGERDPQLHGLDSQLLLHADGEPCCVLQSTEKENMRCDMMRCDAMRCYIMWCNTTWHNAIWHDMMCCDRIGYRVMWYDVLWCDRAWYDLMCSNMIVLSNGVLQHKVVRYDRSDWSSVILKKRWRDREKFNHMIETSSLNVYLP